MTSVRRLGGDLAELVPAPIELGTVGAAGYLLEEARSGDDGLQRVRSNELSMASVESVVNALGDLHSSAARTRPADDLWMDRWVHEPIDRLAGVTRRSDVAEALETIRERLMDCCPRGT